MRLKQLKFLLTFLLVAFAIPRAQAEELIVADGSTTSQYAPVYGWYYDQKCKSTMIYSSSILSDMDGGIISVIKFHANANITFSGGEITVKLGEVEATTISSHFTSGLTQVYKGTPATGSKEYVITLDTPYEYKGGNLAVEVELTKSGSNYPRTYFYGVEQSENVTYCTYGNYGYDDSYTFLPKATFTYSTNPTIKVEPETLIINVEPYTLSSATFTVKGTNLTGDIYLSASGSGFAVTPTTITPAEAANGKSVTVTFSKEIEGTFNGTITLTSEGAESKTVNVTANVAWPVTSGTVTPTSLNFETYAGIATSQTISIENTGNRAFTPAFTVAAPFSIAAATEIAVGETKTFEVTYAPTAAGTDNGTLTVNVNNTVTDVTLNGTANEALKELTVEDGIDEKEELPIYGYQYDHKQINQMIYPARDLASLAGNKIISMTFYSPRIYYSGGKYNVSVGLTDQSVYEEDRTRITGLTQVATDLVAEATTGEAELKINFSEPFTYEAGKNLVIDFEVTEAGSYGGPGNKTSFYGSSKGNYVAYNSYSSNQLYNDEK